VSAQTNRMLNDDFHCFRFRQTDGVREQRSQRPWRTSVKLALAALDPNGAERPYQQQFGLFALSGKVIFASSARC
jgi:hypothetical protein